MWCCAADLRGRSGDTIRPRLEAAGADLAKVIQLEGVRTGKSERMATLADLDPLRKAIEEIKAAFVIVDPLMAALPGRVDSHRDQDIRHVLAGLAKLASESRVAVLVVRHLNKHGTGNPLYRGGGSIGIIGAVRSGLLVAPDPEDPNGKRRILAVTKSNFAALPSSLAYQIGTKTVQHDSLNLEIPFVDWLGLSKIRAADLLVLPKTSEERSALDEAMEFLEAILGQGRVASDEVTKEARKAGISNRTLNRARAKLGVKAIPEHGGKKGVRRWHLELPDPNKEA